jgi:hypothetical protein
MKIIFSSVSAPFFSEYLASITGEKHIIWNRVPMYRKINSYLFLVGLYSPTHSFYQRIGHFKKIIILFAGSDLLRLNKMRNKDRTILFNQLKKDGVIFAVESPEIYDRIKNIYNLKTEIIYLPSRFKFSEKPYGMPNKFSVGCYMPCNKDISKDKRFFYGFNTIVKVVKKLPEVNFYFYHNKGRYIERCDELKLKNFIGCKKNIINMPEFLRNISCGLRLTDHDTYSMSAIEYNLAGRWFINNYPMPYCDKISHKAKVSEVVDKIIEAKSRKGTNTDGMIFYRSKHDRKVFHTRIKDLFLK